MRNMFEVIIDMPAYREYLMLEGQGKEPDVVNQVAIDSVDDMGEEKDGGRKKPRA